MGMDHFTTLGLPRRFVLELADLESAYLPRSRALHPDYHQLGSSADQAASVEMSATLNEAYATLKDPFRRAEYLLALAGGPTASELKDVPAPFLEEMLELRMEIAELEPGSPAADQLESQLTARRDALLNEAGQLFDGPDLANRLPDVRRKLNATKYVRNLVRDLRAAG